jgi:uncharacterized protein DUF3306
MSEPESALARWARRKAEAGAGERDVSAATPVEPARPANGSEPTLEAFDPAGLPAIESIVAGTDIRSFLRAGVPPELARQALRRAWASDPEIRDFIGIAENQWDFNDPTAMVGFGPLTEAAAASALAAQAPATAVPLSAPQAAQQANGGAPVAGRVEQAPAVSPENLGEAGTAHPTGEPAQQSLAADDPARVEAGAPRTHRSHGGALPR